MLYARQLERGARHNVKARILLPSADLHIKLCCTGTCLLRSPQWEGCTCGDSQWTLTLS